MEQRDFTRIRSHLVATVTASDGEWSSLAPPGANCIEGATRDLALGGVFVSTAKPFVRGTRCRLRFRAGDEHSDVEFEGVVARVEPTGMGIRFIEIDTQAYDRLRRNLVD